MANLAIVVKVQKQEVSTEPLLACFLLEFNCSNGFNGQQTKN